MGLWGSRRLGNLERGSSGGGECLDMCGIMESMKSMAQMEFKGWGEFKVSTLLRSVLTGGFKRSWSCLEVPGNGLLMSCMGAGVMVGILQGILVWSGKSLGGYAFPRIPTLRKISKIPPKMTPISPLPRPSDISQNQHKMPPRTQTQCTSKTFTRQIKITKSTQESTPN